MQVIASVQALPKQQFTVVLDNTLYDIALIETAGCMSVNITRGGEPEAVVEGWRCVAGQLVIPQDREDGYGNFLFITSNNELPWWESFGTTQVMMYAGPDEIAAVRGG